MKPNFFFIFHTQYALSHRSSLSHSLSKRSQPRSHRHSSLSLSVSLARRLACSLSLTHSLFRSPAATFSPAHQPLLSLPLADRHSLSSLNSLLVELMHLQLRNWMNFCPFLFMPFILLLEGFWERSSFIRWGCFMQVGLLGIWFPNGHGFLGWLWLLLQSWLAYCGFWIYG